MVQPDQRPKRTEAILNGLLEKATVQGYLTADDLLEHDPESSRNTERMHQLRGALRRRGVEVLDHLQNEDSSTSDDEEYTARITDSLSSDDTVGMYLKEMSRVALLSVDEEVQIAIRIEKAQIAKKELLKLNGRSSSALKAQLEMQITDGEAARDHLIKANTRLVVSIAKRYIGSGIHLLDLIQEGNLGLMKAVEKFDYHKGFRFSTYATWWIRQTITRAIADQSRTIRVPVHMSDRIRQVYKLKHQLEQSLGRTPTTEEIAAAANLPVPKVQWIIKISWTPLSLESPVGDDEDSELGMFIEDEHSLTPMQSAYQSMLKEKLEDVLASLPIREARVLRMRFGLEDGKAYTLEEVGQKFGLTRERIRQIENRALRRLRHPRHSRLLKDYL